MFLYGLPTLTPEPKFQLFEKAPKRFYWGRNYTFLTAYALLMSLLVVFDQLGVPSGSWANTVLLVGMVGVFSSYILLMIYSHGEKAIIFGNYSGYIEFYPHEIVIKDRRIPVNDILSLDFDICDYAGRPTGSVRGIDPKMSNGIDNSVTITLKNGQEIRQHFQLDYEGHQQVISEAALEYLKKRILSLDHAVRIMGINTKEGILDLREKLFNNPETDH